MYEFTIAMITLAGAMILFGLIGRFLGDDDDNMALGAILCWLSVNALVKILLFVPFLIFVICFGIGWYLAFAFQILIMIGRS